VSDPLTIDEYLSQDNVHLIERHDDVILVHDNTGKFAEQDIAVGPEQGYTSKLHYEHDDRELNAELRGQNALRVYDKMRRSDAATRSSLRAIKTPVTGATYYIQSASDSPVDKEIANFIQWNLFKGMTYSFVDFVLTDVLLMLDFGYFFFEKVWAIKEINGENRAYLKKLAPRSPRDVDEWNFDAHGGPESVDLYAPFGSETNVRINVNKLAIFSFDKEEGNIFGLSILRTAYKHWIYKEGAYKIDAVQKERHGIGVPVVKLPMNVSTQDKADAVNMARNLRTNQRAHAVLPFGWEVLFAKLEGQPVSALETAEHHSKMIFLNVLAQAMWSSGGTTGTDSEVSMALFYKSIRQIANLVVAYMNMYVIPQIVRFNWDVDEYPELRVRKLGDTKEARELSFAIRNLVGSKVMRIDDPTEAYVRDALDAPQFDPSTERVIEEAPGKEPGESKQSKAEDMQKKPKSNAGDDKSGG